MKQECFIIPTKIDNDVQSFYIHRCLKSIRTFYPSTLIIIALSTGTNILEIDDPNIIQVKNPYFSTLGCIYLFHIHKYANYAYILHDSMTLTSILPPSKNSISFMYMFDEPGMSSNIYAENYKKILTPSQCYDMINNQKIGCFGVSMGLDQSIIENIGILELIPSVTTKTDFCAMERIFAYLCDSNGITYDVLCGSIFGCANPWENPQLSTMSFDEIVSKNYGLCVIKTLVGRTE